ncbi:Dyp-type peroxidase [Marinomonas sp. PE14-40]|uniref:Dyp-type peroxidase n=1 Tax=Marinomonas sp. PE14-40 TaxID=3060621 RepID=UPI003F66B6AB
MSNIYQSGITATANTDALFITLNVLQHKKNSIKAQLNKAQSLVSVFQQSHAASNPHGVIAIGSEFWQEISPNVQPKELTSFPDIQSTPATPVTPVDLLLHIRSNRRDLTYLLAKEIMTLLSGYVEIVEEVSCFRYLDSRDLTGFVDGTENPEGSQRANVALVKKEDDAEYANGSYIHLQRFVHNLDNWQTLATKEQEDIIGRTKQDNIEYKSEDKPLTAHVKRASAKNDQGEGLEILRHSMPYASLSEAGLLFASYCNSPVNFSKMLENMMQGDGSGHTDKLMQYTKAVTGQAFFAPSISWFEQA